MDIAISRILDSGNYVLGPEVEDFERAFAAYCEADFAIGVGNGLDALKLGLIALGVGEGDEVLVPTNTFIASWLAISHIGATPVPVEPDPETLNINVDLLQGAVTSRTKAVMPVHLYGEPADLAAIKRFAADSNLRVIEDAAQAHGARYLGKRIGSHSDVVAWSFYPGKNLGAMGDGGALTTNDPEIADRVRMLRNYGSIEKYVHTNIGFNTRLDALQAAVLNVKLKYLESWNAVRKSSATLYLDRLSTSGLQLPKTRDANDCAWHLFVIRTAQRDALRNRLHRRGIETGIHYPTPPHLQNAYRSMGYRPGSFPISERIAEQCLSLPIGPHLNQEELEYVCEAILEHLE